MNHFFFHSLWQARKFVLLVCSLRSLHYLIYVQVFYVQVFYVQMFYVQMFYVQMFYVQMFYVQMFYVQMSLCDDFGPTLTRHVKDKSHCRSN